MEDDEPLSFSFCYIWTKLGRNWAIDIVGALPPGMLRSLVQARAPALSPELTDSMSHDGAASPPSYSPSSNRGQQDSVLGVLGPISNFPGKPESDSLFVELKHLI